MNTSTQRRLSHDLRGSLANLRIGLQACRETPELFSALNEAMLEEVERLDHRLVQLGWMVRSAEPQKRECNLQALVASWATERGIARVECPEARVCLDPDLLRAAFNELCDNAVRHGGGIAALSVVAGPSAWELQLSDQGPGWPAGLKEWLEDPQLWHNQIALGLPLVKKLLASHGGSLVLDHPPARWIVPHGLD